MLQSYFNIFVIFILMFLGYFLSFKQWFSNHTADTFSKMVLNLGLPCNMFINITSQFTKQEFLALFSGMIIPLLSMSCTFFIGILLSRSRLVQVNRRGVFVTMFTCSNTIFIGLPINLAIFGEKAVPYVLLYYIVNTSLFWTFGVFQITKDSPYYQQATLSFHPLVFLKKLFSPALLGFIVGLIWVLCQWPVPKSVIHLGNHLGNLTTPLSMFAIGIMMYFQGIQNLKINREMLLVLIGRFLLSPLIVWLCAQWIHIPKMMLLVFLVQSSMPVQNSVPILARTYQADEAFAASTMSFSVFIYLFYIPLLLILLPHI
ncbi:AEC family transporter [Enterococcus columbae]|uniref:Auxin efflux carrier n=1 Tax=Enterococcus columbae DSM 7374 = ATCC 51263 TaxID=1121865 RepID=S0KT71_9ENTE|nr:AEC family transporter [Enterococcus columbae]EOT44185.1 hypothetical protein OMW_00239 [Enterococcus columbae DSM 7374 = ATCC 51263]EOW84343.1 hypothetical protein I568_00837 [Enterococcus columbae DSM 7374 = ATCC 51263]OJG26099.1 hypothetical protein RR47_GL000897 [Enterococcus columbae DSM 7374 = ATCC 51263]